MWDRTQLRKPSHVSYTNVGNNWVHLVDRLDQADKFRSTKIKKMQIDFSPLTIYNTVTDYISADGGENLKSKNRKEIGVRGQFAALGLNSCSLTNWT